MDGFTPIQLAAYQWVSDHPNSTYNWYLQHMAISKEQTVSRDLFNTIKLIRATHASRQSKL